MNQRSRSSRAKSSPSPVEERIHRFLRPGALARLRDSRISTARSASLALLDLALPSFPSPPALPPPQIDGLRPFFAVGTHGPRFPRRKKLAAAKSVYVAPSSPDLADPFLEAFGVDLVSIPDLQEAADLLISSTFSFIESEKATLDAGPTTIKIMERPPELQRSESIAFELEGALLASRSLFPYFMLVCLEAGNGGPLRAVGLLLVAPLLRLLELAGFEAAAVSLMIFLSTAGLRVVDLKAAAKAALPKFFMEDLRRGALRAFLADGALRYVATALPRAMAEPFLREYLDADGVFGTELRTCMGLYTGLTSAAGVMAGGRRLEALRDATAGTSVITVGTRRKHTHRTLLSFYARRYWTPPEEPEQPLPRSEYPRPLIFHDGRLVHRPTPLDFLALLLWFPFGIFLAVLRLVIGLFAPPKLTFMGLAATGLRIETQAHEAHLDANSTTVKGSRSHALYVCNHRSLLDPVVVSVVLQRKVTALTYSLSRLSEAISPIPTVRLARDRLQDGAKMRSLIEHGDVIVCPEGTTCREPYLLRFSPLFATIASDIVPVAVTNGGSMFYGTTARGHKCFDCFFFLMNPRPFYGLRFLEKVPHVQRSERDVANEVQRSIGRAVGFECTNLTRKDKYRILAGNDGLDPRMK